MTLTHQGSASSILPSLGLNIIIRLVAVSVRVSTFALSVIFYR